MWVEGPTQLDTPVLVFGMEVEDLAAPDGRHALVELSVRGHGGGCAW